MDCIKFRCGSRKAWLLCVTLVASIIMFAFTVTEAMTAPRPDSNNVIILSIVTCIFFLITVVLLIELRMDNQFEYRQPDYYQQDDDRL